MNPTDPINVLATALLAAMRLAVPSDRNRGVRLLGCSLAAAGLPATPKGKRH